MKPIVIFFILISSSTFAQKVWVKVLDKDSLYPLPRATVLVDDYPVLTNDEGICALEVKLPVKIQISYIGYQTQVLTYKKLKEDTLVVLLSESKQRLNEVEVLPALPAFLFFGSAETQVIDYTFIENYLLVGLYNYKQRKCYLLLLDSNQKIADEQPLPADFDRFYISGIQRYYAVSGSAVQEILLRRNMVMLKTINSDFFYNKVVYYKGFYGEYLYIMDTHPSKQVHFYYVEHVTKPENTIRIMTILGNQHTYDAFKKDAELNELYRKAEMQKLYALIGEAAADGYYATETKGEFGRKAFFDIKYKDQYSQLFVIDSTVYLFDFIEGNLNRFSFEGSPLESTPITFHQQPGWRPYVQQDELGYYTVYESGERLQVSKLNSDFAEAGPGQFLFHPNPLQWKVHGGYVYYLNAPEGYPLNVFLFREVLK